MNKKEFSTLVSQVSDNVKMAGPDDILALLEAIKEACEFRQMSIGLPRDTNIESCYRLTASAQKAIERYKRKAKE